MAQVKHTVLHRGMPQSMKVLQTKIKHLNFNLGAQLLAGTNLKASGSLLEKRIPYCKQAFSSVCKQTSFILGEGRSYEMLYIHQTSFAQHVNVKCNITDCKEKVKTVLSI